MSLFPAENRNAEFNALRLKIRRFFEFQAGPTDAADLADETISRVAARLAGGGEIESADPYYYFRGFAVNVLREYRRQQPRTVSLDDVERSAAVPVAPNPLELAVERENRAENERRLECLRKTLAELPPENRELFLDYHQPRAGTREAGRLALAERLGIDVTALRNRITRLRKKIEQLILECLGKM
ncbi:MAG: sigma-70 family RNA polymerase sigma factor [Acidobacteria bacterium]|nr:sigma-70 family RNA polymerase sigma factor [Acidobacteriota bacterium]